MSVSSNQYVKVTSEMIENSSLFFVDKNNIISYPDENESFTFDFFNSESVLQKNLKIEFNGVIVRLGMSLEEANKVCNSFPISFIAKT